ncbi:MAG: OmpH family outer membrane protein [Bryobacteraceae bacterium]
MRSNLLCVLAIAATAFGAYAQSPGTKTAIVNFQGALIGTKDGQKAAQELEGKFMPKRKELNDRQAEITSLNDQLRKGSNTMSQEAQAQLEREIQSKNTRLQRDEQDAQDEWNAEQQRLLQGLGQRMIAVITKYAKDNGYSVVMDNSSPNTPILYSSSAIDITQDIITLYDKTSTNGGPTDVPQAPTSSPGTPKPGTPKPSAPGGSK